MTLHSELGKWAELEEELDGLGVPMALDHRATWIREVEQAQFQFAEFRNTHTGSLIAAIPIRANETRVMPGHFRMRIRHLGLQLPPPSAAQVLGALSDWVEESPRILGLSVEFLFLDQELRRHGERAAREAGFKPARSPRRYRHTPCLLLDADEDELLASFGKSCRQSIRNPAKKGYEVGPLYDEALAPRMAELWKETFHRTGASPPARDWVAHLRFARKHPDLYRIIGTFGPGGTPQEGLQAFACAKHNGDHAVYSDGASTRDAEPGVALSYAPMWELIRWARGEGLHWFDMGGMTFDPTDPRQGISDFKRRFTDQVLEVGGEWELRSPSVRGKAADFLSGSASYFRHLLRRVTPPRLGLPS